MQLVVERGVSPIMKGIAALVVVGAVAVAILWYTRRPADGAVDPSATAVPASAQPNAWSLVPPKPKPIAHATKLEPDERKQLAGRITQAQAERGALSAAKRPSLPDSPAPTLDPAHPDETKTTIRTAMREVVPLLGECYEKAIPTLGTHETKVAAKLTLTGDPDIGTIIDAHQILDDAGKPLPASFDDCLRDTMQHIALPPLEGGDTLDVNYPFVFRH